MKGRSLGFLVGNCLSDTLGDEDVPMFRLQLRMPSKAQALAVGILFLNFLPQIVLLLLH